MGCDRKNRYQKIYFMPFFFIYYASYTACSEPNHELFHYFLGKDQCLQSKGPPEIVHQPFCTFCSKKIKAFTVNCTIKFWSLKKGTRKLILMTVADKQAQPFPLHLLLLLRGRVINHTNSSGKRRLRVFWLYWFALRWTLFFIVVLYH